MTFLQPVESLRGRRRRRWVFDGLVALLAGLLSVGVIAQSPVPAVIAVAVGVAMPVALIFRRIWPAPVFVVMWIVAASIGLFDIRISAHVGLLVALSTVALYCRRREVVGAVVLMEIGVVVASLRFGNGSWWVTAILLSGMVAAATGIGLYRATRQAYLAELQDRAARLERERDQQGELAAAAERARIAREMHDIVAHNLTVMIALADGAAAAAALSPDRAVEAMRTVSATGRAALADTRRLLGVLRDDTGADGASPRRPLPDLSDVDELLGRVREAGLPVRYEVRGDRLAVPPGVQLTMFRLIQEALTNTMKHGGSGASAVVRLSYAAGELRVDVEDDGVGANGTGESVGPGRGLAGMRERVTAFGGEVRSGPGRPHGWQVSARMSLDEPVNA